ncbi:MAG: ABC transporter permease [Eubacterium sp.]|nr:ABC transporter permease [Eubacterium sp.]
MQIFKLFLKIFKSHIPTTMIYVTVFFALAIPMSKVGADQTSFKEKSISLCIYDEDNTEASRKLIDYLGKKNRIIEKKYEIKELTDMLYYNQIGYAFVIKKGYSDRLSDTADKNDSDSENSLSEEPFFENYKMHEFYATEMMEQTLNEYISMVRAYTIAGNPLMDAIKKTEATLSNDIEVTYKNFDSVNTVEDFPESISFYFRYLPYIFISIFVNVLCPILLTFRKKDLKHRVACSSATQSSINIQTFFGSSVIVLGIWLLFAVGGVFMMGRMYHGIAWIGLLNSLIFALISAMIALLVTAFEPGESVISMITQIIGLGMCFLCGVFVPQTMLGDGVLAAARFLPAYWYIRATDSLSGSTQYDSGDIWMCLAIEVGFLILLTLATILVTARKPSAPKAKHVL